MGSTLGIILSGIGTGFSAMGQIRAGNAQAQLAEQNAAVQELKAQDAAARGKEDESRFRSSVRRLIGSQRAGFAAQGVKVDVGSPVDVQADTTYLGELDALTIRLNAARESWGYKVAGQDERTRGRIAKQTGRTAAVETILTGAGRYMLDRYGFEKAKGS